MLTIQLRDLEANDLVKRTAYPEIPPRAECEITPSAKALRPVFDELSKWSKKHDLCLAVVRDDLPKHD
jgi:DNA-binding HxlR family transcriptional regulator